MFTLHLCDHSLQHTLLKIKVLHDAIKKKTVTSEEPFHFRFFEVKEGSPDYKKMRVGLGIV